MSVRTNQKSADVTYKFVTEYQTKDGKDVHQCFEVLGVPDNVYTEAERRIQLAEYIKTKIIFQGYKPTRILYADCDLTLDELQALTDGFIPKDYFVINEIEVLFDIQA